MAKSIVKEIIIGLLLCLAIILVLAVLMYSYIPNNKVIPEQVSYKVPDEAKKALEEATMDASQVILTYEVNSSDLSMAQRTNDYNPGKVNPFSSYQVQETTTKQGENTTTAGSSTGSTSTGGSKTDTTTSEETSTGNSTTGNSTSSGGTYVKDKGTK